MRSRVGATLGGVGYPARAGVRVGVRMGGIVGPRMIAAANLIDCVRQDRTEYVHPVPDAAR